MTIIDNEELKLKILLTNKGSQELHSKLIDNRSILTRYAHPSWNSLGQALASDMYFQLELAQLPNGKSLGTNLVNYNLRVYNSKDNPKGEFWYH